MSPNLELNQIENFDGELFQEPEFHAPDRLALEHPFNLDDLIRILSALPARKALAPDGLPTIFWKIITLDIASIIFHTIQGHYI